MLCPYCRVDNDKVIDSRTGQDGFAIRRRRECVHCGRRFTTYERVEEPVLKVVKKDGVREPFDRDKIKVGLQGLLQTPGQRRADREHRRPRWKTTPSPISITKSKADILAIW